MDEASRCQFCPRRRCFGRPSHLRPEGCAMRPIAQVLPENLRRGSSFAIAFFVSAMILAYEVAISIVNNDLMSLALVGLTLVGGAVVVAVLNSWSNGLYIFLGWLLFEDLARKYLGNNMAIYFAKDILVAILYCSFFMAYRRKEKD